MLLRTIVSHYLRQIAEQKVHEVAQDAMRGQGSDQQGEAERDTGPCDIAVVFGHKVEAGGLVDLLGDAVTTRYAHFVEHVGRLGHSRIAIVESGEGLVAATEATRQVIELRHPQWVISAGFATALEEDLRRGTVVMPQAVVNPAGERLKVGFHIDPEVARKTRGMAVGDLATSAELLIEPGRRRELGQRVACMACDLESSAVAQVCQEQQIRFLAVRIVTDLLDDELPLELARLGAQETFSAKLGVAAGAMFRRPSYVKDLWQQKEDAIRASDRLAKFLSGVLPQLN